MKLKFDKETLQQFFLAHSEKIALGVVVLLFCLFVYGAAARPTYDKTPQRLQSAAAEAQRHIEETKNARKPLQYADWPALARLGRKTISDKPYEQLAAWNPPLFPERRKRVEPKLYPVEKLVASADVGQFSFREASAKAAGGAAGAAAAASSISHGQRWVVITGLVPWADQVTAYREAFRDNPRPDGDTPVYPGYRLERAEIEPGSDPANAKWQPLDFRSLWAVRDRWSTTPSDVAPGGAIHEVLTFPLGPLNGAWDHRVVHPPEIPLASSIVEEAAPEAETTPAPPSDFLGLAPAAKPKPKSGAADAAPSASGPAPASAPSAAQAVRKPAEEEAKWLLFRAFDFNVEPGKQYQYRVQLVLSNPNFGAEVTTLADEKLGKDKYVFAKWSEPSGVVLVPPDTRTFIESLVGTSNTRFEEIGLSLSLVKWMHDGGAFSVQRFRDRGKLFRGQWLNFVLPIASLAGASGASDDAVGLAGDSPAPKGKTRVPTTDYNASLLLVDFRGALPGRDAAKQEMPQALFLDVLGNFRVHNEADDAAEMERITSPRSDSGSPGAAPAAGASAPSAPSAGPSLLDDGGRKPGKPAPKAPSAPSAKPAGKR